MRKSSLRIAGSTDRVHGSYRIIRRKPDLSVLSDAAMEYPGLDTSS